MTTATLSLILFTVFLSACAQLALKMGMSSDKLQEAIGRGPTDAAVAAALSPGVWSGLVIYGVSVVLWLYVLSKVELSTAYPFVGISFIFTMLFGIFILGETVSLYKIAGTLLVVVGCLIIAK